VGDRLNDVIRQQMQVKTLARRRIGNSCAAASVALVALQFNDSYLRGSFGTDQSRIRSFETLALEKSLKEAVVISAPMAGKRMPDNEAVRLKSSRDQR
jgi:hypothetical protein